MLLASRSLPRPVGAGGHGQVEMYTMTARQCLFHPEERGRNIPHIGPVAVATLQLIVPRIGLEQTPSSDRA